MSRFTVAVPITSGFQVFEVEDAANEEEAKEMVLSGEVDAIGVDKIELNLDSNTWEIE